MSWPGWPSGTTISGTPATTLLCRCFPAKAAIWCSRAEAALASPSSPGARCWSAAFLSRATGSWCAARWRGRCGRAALHSSVGRFPSTIPTAGPWSTGGNCALCSQTALRYSLPGWTTWRSSNPSTTSPGYGLRRRRSCWRPTSTSSTSACGHSVPTTSR